MNRRLLITGGSGYLGRHLVRMVAAQGSGPFAYTTFAADPLNWPQGTTLDLRDGPAVARFVAEFAPTAVIHTAGSNRTPDMTAVIVEGTRHVVEAGAAVGARLIHLSTDSVFEGMNAPYDETAAPAPLNDYGRAKAAAEALVAEQANAVTVRTSLIYGLEEMDNGTAWMVEALRAGRPVTLFTNQIRNPVWVETLCQACLELVEHPYRGVLNVAGRQAMTRAAFGLRLLDWWGIKERATLSLGSDESGRWPLDCRMDVGLARRLLRVPLWGVDEVLARARRDNLSAM
ncbi:MAG: sugar nucleotide-binding protein [Candidatus Promineofilum sp.]|nr:sugar nucleotide-binding protein [Promineifilum sp.]